MTLTLKETLYWAGMVIILALVAALLSYAPHKPQTPAKSPILGGMATSSQGDYYEYAVNTQYYTIDAKYPRVLPLAPTAASKAERTMEQAIADQISSFKSDSNLDNLTPQDAQIQGLDGTRKYDLETSFTSYQSTSTVSYVFMIYADTLGAHPNGNFLTFTFDKAGNALQLSDLFQGQSWLADISQKVTADVVAQMKERLGTTTDITGTLFEEGLAPKEENFQNFALNGGDLLIFIPPYQAAAYAAGDFEVAIPLQGLDSDLKQTYQ